MAETPTPMDATPPEKPEARRLLVGIVGPARGLKGEVWVRSFTADPAAIGAYGPLEDEAGSRSYVVEARPAPGGRVVARIRGIDSRSQADALAGTKLFVARAVLPAPGREEYYFADLVGLRAETAAGKALGTVSAVHDYGAGASLEIADGEIRVLVPFTVAAVPVVAIAEGRVVVEPPPGLWPEARPPRPARRRRHGSPAREKADA